MQISSLKSQIDEKDLEISQISQKLASQQKLKKVIDKQIKMINSKHREVMEALRLVTEMKEAGGVEKELKFKSDL